ncbi:MAG TPA: hypothetical protein PLN05_07850 [Pyrinomonadaceae bacterium]|nr:hypothetical protein [Chloracidobacterium sp.]HRJ90297.1 hypothetical protein [Pyrinomonadaceae bacterium]HRK50324.1 hypothetical protein [Pyrinomonadaceae bacterium]
MARRKNNKAIASRTTTTTHGMRFQEYLTQENVSIALSILALIVSILSPVVAYFFLVPQMQEFRNRPRLGLEVLVSTEVVPAISNVTDSVPYTFTHRHFAITNLGSLPAKNVQVVFQYTTLSDGELPPTDIAAKPPIGLDARLRGTNIEITLQTPIAPDETVFLTPKLIPDEAWVFTEYGERQSILLTGDTGRQPKPSRRLIVEPVK